MKQPILITGSHRSGTTWVGKILSTSPNIGYIHEPFNIESTRPGISGRKFENWFQYVTPENEDLYYPVLKRTLEFKYHLASELQAIRSMRDVGRFFRDYSRFCFYRLMKKRPLMKDPIALMSAEWLAERFNMKVIIMIRHPAAFVSSLKRKNWQFDFNHFLRQPLLMRDLLSPFEEQIKAYAAHPPHIIDQGILLWKIFHHVIYHFQQKHPDWLFVRHEDLSWEPIKGFKQILDYIQEPFDRKMEKIIEDYTGSSNPEDVISSEESFKRNSRANIFNWKKRLSPEEILHIKEGVSSSWNLFYTNEEW